MHLTIGFLVVGSLAWQAIAAPAYPPVLEYIISEQAPSWNAGAVDEYPIHTSCNATERVQLRQALAETVALADHAKEHVLRWGNSSEHYRRYFGDQPTSQVVGNLDKIVSSDKGGVLFRCDNPDGNCQLEGYGGHWRGENGTDETVICPRSFSTRRSLVQMCALGYNVAEYPTNTYFASDLMHRIYHMPAIGEYDVEHFTEDYADVLAMAQDNATYSVRDSDTLQYFALDVYAYDIAIPGVGCSGPGSSASDESPSPSTTALASSSTEPASTLMTSVTSTTTPTPTTPEAASITSEVPEGCHTHEGGELHCP